MHLDVFKLAGAVMLLVAALTRVVCTIGPKVLEEIAEEVGEDFLAKAIVKLLKRLLKGTQ